MTQAREPLGIVDGAPPNCDFSTKTKRGFFVSRNLGFILVVIFGLSLVATALIVYNFVACPRTDQLANVTKLELHNCADHSTKFQVIPLQPDTSLSVLGVPDDATTTAATTNSAEVTDKKRVTDVRLPRAIHPNKYDIKLTPYIVEGNFTFDGEVSIELNVTEDTKNVTFHAVELSFLNVILYQKKSDGSKVVQKITGQSEDVLRQFYIIHILDQLKAGELYVLNISFTGILNDNLHGFYRSSYVEKNVTKWIAITQFQPTDARRAFPCFDEPALKAKFTISLARPKNMSSVSNMNAIAPPQQHSTLPDYVWDNYAESLPMSTYLVAFAVTDFSHKSDGNFAVWARREAIESASYALEIGPKLLKFCEEYYKIKFPLPKIDMIAVPDFSAGAMENWGLLTFRTINAREYTYRDGHSVAADEIKILLGTETTMLFSNAVSPATTRARVAAVVAHEIAHQWFGNLVTPAWWSDIWLNEGFASYVEYVAVDAVEKSWKSMEQFVISEVQSVFHLDALASSHQISVEVGNPEEINDIFDKISYGKGSAVLRMMNHFLRDEVFNAGITTYLNSKKFGNAEQRDLWKALTDTAKSRGSFDSDVGVVMDTWTLQTGFPVITIIRDYRRSEISFVQERFVLINATHHRSHPPVWWVPISFTTASENNFNDTYPKLWMRGERKISVRNITIKPDDWFIANVQQTGFYRVNYDQRNWNLLIQVLNDKIRFKEVHPINRAQIVDDAMNLALAGRLSYQTALDITKYLEHERSYVPWKAGLVALGYIDSMLSKGPYYLEYKRHVVRLLAGAAEEVGWEAKRGESVIRIQQRAELLGTACHLEHAACLQHAVRLYTNWMMTPNPDTYNEISADVRGAVYCAGVSAGGVREWTFAWDRFRAASAPSERELLLSVLGCTRAPYLLSRYLEFALRNDTGIRKQDAVRVFAAVSNSVVGQPIAFSFVRTNWQRLKDYLGSSSSNLNAIIKVVTKRFNQKYELEELKKFAAEHCSEAGRTIDQALERTEANIQWMEKNYKTIVDWLLSESVPPTANQELYS